MRATAARLLISHGLSDDFARNKQLMWQAFLRKNGLEGGSNEMVEVVKRIRAELEWIWIK
jgi:hypothetical protein